MRRSLGKHKTTPNLSSRSLFHFTNDISTLGLILNGGFQARYIYEKLPGRKIAYFTETTCFCDIPLSLVKEHINWYGDYGIGIDRTHAREFGLSPIFYIHSKSPGYPKGSSRSTREWFENFKFLKYLKQVRGKQIFFNNDDSPYWKWKTFYNEREWRYFPKENNTFLEKYERETDLEEKRIELNKVNSLQKFQVNTESIEYILIKDSKDLEKLISEIKKSPHKNNLHDLLTKVITVKQIVSDF
jgi:hypothetical protein